MLLPIATDTERAALATKMESVFADVASGQLIGAVLGEDAIETTTERVDILSQLQTLDSIRGAYLSTSTGA